MGTEQSKQLKRAKKNVKLINSTTSTTSSTSSQSVNRTTIKQSEPFDGKIVVVSKGDNQKDESQTEKEFLNYLLNHHFNPLLPKNQDTIPANYQQIDSISMNNLCKIVQSYLKEKSELSVKEQNIIFEKIKKVDYVTAFIANLIIEREKSQNKTIDIFNRINELKMLTDLYQADVERCFKNVELLNNSLDEQNRIEIQDL